VLLFFLTSRGRSGRSLAVAAVTGIALVLGTGAARAQSATPLERYQPTPIGDALFASPSAAVDAHLALDAGLRFSFANGPLALRSRDASGAYTDLGAIVGRQAVLHAQVSAALFSRLQLELDMPMTVDQGGDSPAANGATIASPSGFALNDLRIGARFAALAPRGFFPGGGALALDVGADGGREGVHERGERAVRAADPDRRRLRARCVERFGGAAARRSDGGAPR
jgi:hypothetical protein